MGRRYDFDYIVIGSGPSGSAAATELAKAGKKIALVEEHFFGGTNLNTRDIPFLISSDFSHTYSKILEFPELKNQEVPFNLPTIPARQLKTVIDLGGNNKKIFENLGITCIKGHAHLLDSHTVAVDDKKFTSTNFILATGAKLKTEEISGIDFVKYFTPEEAIKIARLPKVAAIIGGGATGVEIAEYYAELGIKVIIFESSDHLLPREDKEAGNVIADYFTKKLGITVLPSCKVVALEEDEKSKRVIFRYKGSEKVVRVDCVVIATGSIPNLDYGLENAKVKYRHNGILANKNFETSAKNIYAIGDCLGKESSTDRAYHEGMCLAANLISRTKSPLNYRGLVKTIKTYPEVATVGFSEETLIRRKRKYKKAVVALEEITASKIFNFNYGFIKLLADRTGKIIGATIVAPNAELLISEVAVAVRHNLTALELASAPHNINSLNYLVKLAAKKIAKKEK